MADSIVRLKVESSEYDQKLKRAAEGLTRYADECRKVGGTLEVVEKETLDYVRALGQMDTVSRTATGKLAEMKKTFTELSVVYKNMTDEEKNSPFGKALATSLDQLKVRIGESKAQLNEVNQSLVGGGGLKDALDALDEKEQELLELFLGKKISTTSTHSYTIPLANGVTEYTVAKFAAQSGLKPASAADGDVVKLTLTPGAEPKFSSLQEVEASNKAAIAVRIANFATCSVAAGNKMIGTNTLPVFELGRTAYILGSAKK